MKVRLFNCAALAAVTLASQGLAQQQEASLERALADLNEGLTAQGDANNGPVWGGFFRARNRWFDDGTETNNVDIDVVATLSMLFNINEDARIFAEINDSTTFGDDTFGGTSAGTYDDRRNGTFDVPRFYAEVDNLVGLGGTAKIGRDEYHVGSGRLIGTDHWDNVPSTHNGIWYDNEVVDDFLTIHTSLTNDIDTGNVDENDGRLWVLAAPMTLDVGSYANGIEVTPYYIRYDGVSGAPAIPFPGGGESGTWIGVDANGEVLGFMWGFEFADFSSGDFGGTAFAVDLGYDLEAAESLPMIEDGNIFFRFSSSDEEFAVIAPSYHNAAGFSDRLGSTGQWTPNTDLFGLGIGIVPAQGWDGELAFYSVEQDGVDEWTEIDLSVGTELGGGVDSWFGIAFVDPDAGESELVFWTALELAFGSELPAAPAP